LDGVDGDIDYSKYGRPALEDALSRIDRGLWPKNYENLSRELARRPPPADPPKRKTKDSGSSDPMKSGNPALSVSTFDGLAASDNPMTLSGTINKTAMLLALVLVGAGWAWNVYFASHRIEDVLSYVWIGSLGGLLVALVTIFNKQIAAYTAPAYAVLEGLAVGALSALYEARQPGIAIQAAGLTFAILAVMLVAYRFELIKVTEHFKAGVIAATGGIAILYMADLVLMYFGHPVAMIHDSGTWGIAFSLFVIFIASLNLVMDFDFIAKGVAQRSPKYMEWYSAFGLVVTLIWLYLEILRLLGKRR
jgi:uncharacterized YccA/Bax inhibitor family protein